MESIEYGDIPRLSTIPFIVFRGFLILSHTALIFFQVRAVLGRPVLGWSCVISQFFVSFSCIIDRRFSNFKLSYTVIRGADIPARCNSMTVFLSPFLMINFLKFVNFNA